MIDRTQIPAIKPVEAIQFVQPQMFDIANDVRLFWMNEVADETVRIELHFDAGVIAGERRLAGFTNQLLLSGTATKTSTQIHNELDLLGAYVDCEVGMEKAVVAIYCLKENLQQTVKIVVDALQHVDFPESEIEDLLREGKQSFLVASEKVSVLTRREFQQRFFSNDERYGSVLKVEDYENVDASVLKAFHAANYLNGLKKVIVVGDLENAFIDELIAQISKWTTAKKADVLTSIVAQKGRFHVEKADAVQTAIRIGLPMFNKKDARFLDFVFMQTIFGDYFGSRLMSNIREDKGYTYGIGSALLELTGTGYFVIATEVGADVTEATLHEIQVEMKRLQDEKVGEEELNLVKNYMLGQILKSADGANAMMDLFQSVEMFDLDYTFYNAMIHDIKSMTAVTVQDMAIKYLNWDEFTIVTAGK